MRYAGSLRSESITASDAGKLRVGPVGKPSLRAVAVSRRPWAAESAAVRGGGRSGGVGGGVVRGGGGGGVGRRGIWASSAPAAISNRAASPAALAAPARARRARRFSTTHAH